MNEPDDAEEQQKRARQMIEDFSRIDATFEQFVGERVSHCGGFGGLIFALVKRVVELEDRVQRLDGINRDF